MKFIKNWSLLLAAIGLLMAACSKEVVETETFGDIDGIVLDGETLEGVSGVNITTSPASNSILTSEDGTFLLENVPTGNYTIQTRKRGYDNRSVSVAVREDRTASATIVIDETEDDTTASSDDLEAEITNWFNTTSGDSSFVEVDYRFQNMSNASDITEYEVYFEILTDGETYYFEVAGEDLRSGQSRSGDFRKYIRQATASDVLITDIWISQD
ncbi:MAG: DUF2012 domain-containing protein [Balneolaceae bacterium]|nr:DUF2012 domain-containing protein [Balneolaceae bacterium]MCH8549670.1 carboxypeptidase-like regulatory domain-containing protein [Balneolaceae bacterium]